ncbi:hypothetical protein LAUMK4_05738 [Mycobacterium persicum]|uniref:Uncharacterized protein n=1 Tax=Mycobacterium persicum TaxID=1487726 RepID=A0ABY6RS74_9MYCO|nr:hypothetical protein [Mycobacterium persicum]VBA32395.1 hypothetical protein LAUMK4_05738 [Mycobacterium persicum]
MIYAAVQVLAAQANTVAAGAGIINMSHEVLYIVIAVGGVYFLGTGVVRGMRDHWKRGTGAGLSAIAGGVALAVVVAHIVGLYQRGNQEFEHLPGSVGHSNSRGW